MLSKLFRVLLVVSLGASLPMNAGTSCCGGSQKNKAKVICALVIRDCLRVWGNETVEGSLNTGNLAVGGLVTVNGVSINNLAGLAGAIGNAGATGSVGPAGAAGVPGISGIGGVLGYAYACNTAAQGVAAGGIVTFNISTAPFAGITPPAGAGSTFIVQASGVYKIQYHVRGTPGTLTGGTGPSALQFEVTANGTPLTCSSYASSVQSTTLAAAGTEAVNGFTLVSLTTGDVLRLHNITQNTAALPSPFLDTVTLAAVPVGGTSAVNASMLVVRVA